MWLSRTRSLGGLVALAAATACTDVDFFLVQGHEPRQLMMSVEAEVCAPDPLEDGVPYRILFVIDTSLSNLASDPQGRRREAFVEATSTYAADPNVSFGLITFDAYPHHPTPMFTRNENVLLNVADQLSNDYAGGGTNYQDTISAAHQFIVGDIISTGDPLLTLRTHYIIYWVSDGLPTVGVRDASTLVANVAMMRDDLSDKVAEITLNTFFLEGTGEYETPEQIEAARNLLLAMAAAGGGDFVDIGLGEPMTFEIETVPILRPFVLAEVIATNPYVRIGDSYPRTDSDADGLLDDDEADYGCDLANPDSDGDGFRDGVEVLLAGLLTPDVFDSGCEAGVQDPDADGLLDCEEELVSTDPQHPDSDRDHLPDGVELILGSAPTSADPTDDRDLDGLSDWSEVVGHLEPRLPTEADEAERWSYRYELAETRSDAHTPCYAISVTNISVFETVQTLHHPRGAQTVELLVTFETADAAAIPSYLRAERRVGYLVPGVRDPANGRIRLSSDEFMTLGEEG